MTYYCSISTSLFASAHMLRLQTRTDAKKQVGSSATRIKKEQWSCVCVRVGDTDLHVVVLLKTVTIKP